MAEAAGELWRRRGVSLVWDATALQLDSTTQVAVSLRQALTWPTTQPTDTPGGVRTVMVTGLHAVLVRLTASQAEATLRRVRQVVLFHRDNWPNCALVFSLPDPQGLQISPPTSTLTWRRAEGVELPLGILLWGGSANEMVTLVADRLDQRGNTRRAEIGYWVQRVG